VLFTANDAYMRDFNLVIPSDCVASADKEANRYALELMKRVLKADIRPSAELDLEELRRQATDEADPLNPQAQAPQYAVEK
jgi:nicotinamidase-related amidase